MELNGFPDELLSHIIRCFYRPEAPKQGYNPFRPDDLLNARLVCRKWNALATKYAFRTVTLVPWRGGFKAWRGMLDSGSIKAAARRVVIYSSPADCRGEHFEKQWHNDEYPAFTDAISEIERLSLIDELYLRFTSQCHGIRNRRNYYYAEFEGVSDRINTLEAVFKAIKHRASKPNQTKIRSLTIENLQNLPLPELTSSELFQSVTKDLRQLHLHVTQEYNERGPDYDIYFAELVQFEPYMHKHWLSPLADQLTSLSLYFDECWGTMPGTFNGHGLVFPQLKTLNLGSYAISHDDHMDWVLAQTSLQSLRLDRCFIVSHIRTEADKVVEWNISTADWEKLPMGAFAFTRSTDAVYHYPGTWESVFDKIRTRLPNLVDFQFHIAKWRGAVGFDDPSPLPTELSPRRYIVFDIGLCPSRWIEANNISGEMRFGNNDPSTFDDSGPPLPSGARYVVKLKLNRSKETEEGDGRALEELSNATLQRRW
ncbi:hypothetical protein QQX98_004480 [Neonectria punicea]|uniref:F-box domain-containing protein n=1 Tax=Neonectria punicea TaxID=979145 RepID=A0ABR1H9D4_9HYPO